MATMETHAQKTGMLAEPSSSKSASLKTVSDVRPLDLFEKSALRSLPNRTETTIGEDYLDGVEAIAEYLGEPWTIRRVRYARETGALPIRFKRGIGVYAFGSELSAALRAHDSLPRSGTH
jgi:hypothetical protein